VPTLWLDAQLPPQLAVWLRNARQIDAKAVRELGLRDAGDREIFDAGRANNVILLSKDADFVELVSRLGAPPKLIWLTCGNVSNEALQTLLTQRLDAALDVLRNDDIVELG
jgi:predicted nuclease of predicted toxin-antitoxin system